MTILVDFEQPRPFSVETQLHAEAGQNVRVNFEAIDFISSILGDDSSAQLEFNVSLLYSDDSSTDYNQFLCSNSCVDGKFIGHIDVENSKTDTVKVTLCLFFFIEYH